MAAVSKTAKPSAPVVVGRVRSTKTGILPLGFNVLMYHGSFCLLVRIAMCSTLTIKAVRLGVGSVSWRGHTRKQLCRRRYSLAPPDEPILSSRWGYLRCRG